jgi:FkbM family methyltransferase
MELSLKITKLLHKPFAFLFYKLAKSVTPPYERALNLKALGIKSPPTAKLKLNPLDEGFSREFSIYGFREYLNTVFVWYITKKYRPVVIDIGANLGYYVLIELLAGARKVIAIEPIPITYNYLKENVKKYNNVITLNIAILENDGEASFEVLKRFNLAHIVEDSTYLSSSQIVRVKGLSLKTLIKEFNLHNENNIMLRMDIEGYEYRILKNIPEQVSLINVEIHPSKYDVEELCKEVINQGFIIRYFIGDIPFGLYPIVNILGLKSLRLLKPYLIVDEYVKCDKIKELMRKVVHPYIFFTR